MRTCVFCRRGERSSSHPNDVTSILCSHCVQLFLNIHQAQLKELYKLALEKGLHYKAIVLEEYIEEEEDELYAREAKKIRRDLVRKRPLSKARFARYNIRA